MEMSCKNQQSSRRKKCNEKTNNSKVKVAAKSTVSRKSKLQQEKSKKTTAEVDKRYVMRLQDDFLSPDCILRKVFRKDGPPLGLEFDSLPSDAFHYCRGKDSRKSRKSHRACQENRRAHKRQKVSTPPLLEEQTTSPEGDLVQRHGIGKGLMTVCRLTNQKRAPVKKHGIGKGLMTLWRLTNLGAEDLPASVDHSQRAASRNPAPISRKTCAQGGKGQQSITRRLANKVQEKRRSSARSRKVGCQLVDKTKHPRRERCGLALEGGKSEEDLSQYAMLVDDEELELTELQASNPLTCCVHFSSNGLHGCSLCKDLLAKFPPKSVTMKQPFHMQPWDSSPELVKKLFKIFHFLCTYAGMFAILPFTLDEFAQAFDDKDSLLLGKLNVALLKLLLSDVETELNSGSVSHVSKNWKYRGLLQSVEHNESALKFWKRSLNPLTWIEILRQVLVAAGVGLQRDASPREPLNKEAALMARYGLSPGTLKGELFTILSLQGNIGLKVSELATFSSIVALKLAPTTDELEVLISSMLSSDITLFEKISASTYRLRSNSFLKDVEDDQSDLEDFGSLDNDTVGSIKYYTTDGSDDDSRASVASKHEPKKHYESKANMLTVYTEIDESHPGEAWLLGLMEGEYSDLNIEEKLNALMALIDLLSAGSSIRMEEPVTSAFHSVPNTCHIGSGAKIKRSTAKRQKVSMPSGNYYCEMINSGEESTTAMLPVDSSIALSKFQQKSSSNRKRDATEMEFVDYLHPMQSIFLGSDRRYNRYWLFLGPCNACDPGHKRIYFESSEDGHWEVIDTEEALSTFLSSLDRRGRRESHLLSSLEKRGVILCQAMSSMLNDLRVGQPALSGESERSSCSAVSDVDNQLGVTVTHHDNLAASSAAVPLGNREQQKQKWGRLQAFDAWLWNFFYSALHAVQHGRRSFLDSLARCERCHDLYWRDEKHCRICHTTFELDFDLEERYAIHAATCRYDSEPDMFPKHKILSSQLQALKAAAYGIESSMPESAMVGAWTKSVHNLWVKRLRRTSTLAELLQVLADFVGAINEGWLYQCHTALGSDYILEDIIASFQSMPQTSSAVALWLVKLDTLIAPYLKKVDVEKTTGRCNRTGSKGRCARLSCSR